MAQLIDLKDLLKHEILDLYSAEEQIIEALPKLIDKAANSELKKALTDHLKVTELQKIRLDDIKGLMGNEDNGDEPKEKKGFFSKLFGGSGGEKCKGTEGLIKEGEKMMGEDMTAAVMDAAIIGAAQKIEHYEISGYGTAVAYARELGLSNVAGLLKQTLDEEYAADDSLTRLAVGKLNIKAENAMPPKNKPGKKDEKKTQPAKVSLPEKNNTGNYTLKSKPANPPLKTNIVKTAVRSLFKPTNKTSPAKPKSPKESSEPGPSKSASPSSSAGKSPGHSKRSLTKIAPAKSSNFSGKSTGAPISKFAVKSAIKSGGSVSKGGNKSAKGKPAKRR
ncbi:MAG: ferritin-like domain-containing protein [Ginsengibacter sp.]